MRFAALLLFLVTTSASAQWQVERFFPERGTIGGGDIVTIFTTYKSEGLCDPDPCGAHPIVTFGGVPARSASNDRGSVTVITPAHGAGIVPIMIDFTGESDNRNVGSYTFVDAQDFPPGENYEAILFPVAVGGAPVTGANGSRWSSELWVSNRGPHRVELVHGPAACGAACADQPFPGVDGGETRRIELPADGLNAAYRFSAQRGGIDQLSFSLRIRDESRADDNQGTEIRVVRASEFESDLTILNVPIDDHSRTGLRIYTSAGGVPSVDVRVDVFPLSSRDRIETAVVTLLHPDGLVREDSDYFAYVFVADLKDQFPTLPAGAYRLEMAAVDPVFIHPLHALVSVTNNRTQMVTAIAPQ